MKIAHQIVVLACAIFFVAVVSTQSTRKASFVGITSGIAGFGKSEPITSAYHFHLPLGFFFHENRHWEFS